MFVELCITVGDWDRMTKSWADVVECKRQFFLSFRVGWNYIRYVP